jgi:hypothetical protein
MTCCGHIFNGMVCTLSPHSNDVLHFSTERAPKRPPTNWMTTTAHHWLRGWCTRCSALISAPTGIELYNLSEHATCEYNRICRVGHRAQANYGMSVHAVIDYTNWAGSRELRRIRPRRIYFGSNAWHADAQLLLDALDLEKDAMRTFAFATIHDWVQEDVT